MKRLMLVFAALAVLVVWPAAAGAGNVNGTVVGKERGKLLVATPAGAVQAVAGRAALGARVAVTPAGMKVLGRAHDAHLRGIVLRRIGATTFIAANHHVVAVKRARVLAGANPGDVVTAAVTIANHDLDEDDADVVGHANTVMITATIAAVAPGSITLSVNGQNVPLSLPAGLTLPASLVGQTVSLTVKIDDDNVPEVQNEPAEHQNQQGDDDDHGDDHDGGDHGGHGGHGGDDH